MPSAPAGVSVRSMTLEQKVGQMFMLAFAGSTAKHAAALLRDHHVGACYLSNDNFVDPAQAAALAAELQAVARAGSGIPALLAADQEGAWAVLTPHSCPGPGNMGLGATGAVEDTREMYSVFGQELRAAGLRAAIDSGVDIVMTSHILFPALDPDHPATLSPAILRDLLRGTMGFGGVVLTDSFNMGAVRRAYDPLDAVVQTVQAGADMVLLAEERYGDESGDYVERQVQLVAGLVAAVNKGRLPVSRIDDAVARILALKARYRLAQTFAGPRAPPHTVGSPAHREIERRVADHAVVLVQNRGGVVPLNVARAQRIVVLSATDPEGYRRMAAGRGIGPNVVERPSDVASMEIRRRHPDVVSLSVGDGEWETQAGRLAGASAIVVVTEKFPLAGFDFPDESQHRLIRWLLSKRSAPVIVLACRDPYELAQFRDVDAYVCAVGYRPACVRAAVGVLFGDIAPRGRLPVSIPGLYAVGDGVSTSTRSP